MSNKDILIANFEENVKDQNGNSFTVGGSVEFLEDNVVGKYMKVPSGSYLYIDNPEFAINYGDFTLDAWIYYKSNYCSVSSMYLYQSGTCIMPSFNAAFVGYGRRGGYNTVPLTSAYNRWAHYAFVRKDGMLYTFIDGVLASKVVSSYPVVTTRVVINTLYGDSFSYGAGENYYKSVRFSNYARWTEDFKPTIPVKPPVEPPIEPPVIGNCSTPAGAVMHFAMLEAPEGWLVCNGAEVSKIDYAKLFTAIGNTFGDAKDLVDFRLPDLRGEFIRGFDEGKGIDLGRVFGSNQLDALQDHTHGSVVAAATTMSASSNSLPVARVADETRPRNVALLPCIKC